MRTGSFREDSRLRTCFVIPASPTEAFYSQVAMFRLALDSLGGMYKKAPIILSLGEKTIEPIPEKWLSCLGVNTILHWADPKVFHDIGQRAQGDNRWKYNYDDYDVIILSDADTILLKPVDELLLEVKEKNSISGVIAHYPFPYGDNEHPGELWHYFAKKFTGKDISLDYRYTLLESDDQGEDARCPFYVNYGFVAMTPQVFKAIRITYLDIRSNIMPLLKNPIFCGQLALTLAVHKHEIPVMNAPMKYNFPNDQDADKLYSGELKSISVLHYLRTDKFDRQKIFVSEKNFEEFLSLKLEGSNLIFQKFVRKLTNGRYPFK